MSQEKKSELLLLAEQLVRAISRIDSLRRVVGRDANEVALLRRQLKERDDVIRHRDERLDELRRFDRSLEEHVASVSKAKTPKTKAKAVDAMCAFIDEFQTRVPF